MKFLVLVLIAKYISGGQYVEQCLTELLLIRNARKEYINELVSASSLAIQFK